MYLCVYIYNKLIANIKKRGSKMNIEENTRDWEMYDELNGKIKILEERIATLEKRQALNKESEDK